MTPDTVYVLMEDEPDGSRLVAVFADSRDAIAITKRVPKHEWKSLRVVTCPILHERPAIWWSWDADICHTTTWGYRCKVTRLDWGLGKRPDLLMAQARMTNSRWYELEDGKGWMLHVFAWRRTRRAAHTAARARYRREIVRHPDRLNPAK